MSHCFISYSTADGVELLQNLVRELEGGTPYIPAWYDTRNIPPGSNWDDEIVEAIKVCKCMLFVMSNDSTKSSSDCRKEILFALRYKKPIIPLLIHPTAEPVFMIATREWIDFTDFNIGLGKLNKYIQELDLPVGQLRLLKERLSDAEHDLRRATGEEADRIKAEIEDLNRQIETQKKIADNPKKAEEQTQKNIEAGLERERKPEKPTAAQTSTKFINPPPGIAPNYFQDRQLETNEIVKFLQDDSQRLMTIVGRGGVGKTAMVCRLLKGLEGGELPDGLGRMRVEGIVYLSESGSHRVNFANLFYDLCKLLPSDAAQELDAIYKNPQGSTESKMRALLEKFGGGRVVALLDNFEPLVDMETFAIRDAELDEALRAFLNGTHSAVKVVITTRVAPRALNLIQPGRQRGLTLDEGLESPYAENILREMDSDGRLGLKSAGAEALNRARIKTRGFPRALEALFAILASDRYTTLDELLAMPLPENVVEALVGEAFNRLDTNAQKVMQALAVYNRPVTPAAVDYLLAPHLPAMDSAPILQRLASMHFARKESGRFYLHPVDREFAFRTIHQGEKNLEVLKKSDTEFDEVDLEELLDEDTFQVDDEWLDKDDDEDIDDEFNEIGSDTFLKNIRLSRIDFTRYGLLDRAADYFRQARKPRTEWKKLDDLGAQLIEFDLRCAADDYNSASIILFEIDTDYLSPWGHYRLLIEMYENLLRKMQDEKTLGMFIVARLGGAYYQTGKIHEFIKCEEQALIVAQKRKDYHNEGAWLSNLGTAYYALGDNQKAIEYYERALVIARTIGDFQGESVRLENIGGVLLNLCEYKKSEGYFRQAIEIADKISFPIEQINARKGLAQAYLVQDDLVNAHSIIKNTLQYDVSEYNHNASALHGIIALRQGDDVAARGAFVRAIGQADEILSKTAEYYSALDAKGIALSGLVVSGKWEVDSERQKTLDEAVEVFRKARKIAPHAGVVKSVLRLFDELAKCEGGEMLKDIRPAAEGKPAD